MSKRLLNRRLPLVLALAAALPLAAQADDQGHDHQPKDLSGVDLTNASFEGGSLYSCDLTGANLTGVNFRETVMKRVDLKDALLAGANFDAADLSYARNAALMSAGTTPATTCPDLSKGPCQ